MAEAKTKELTSRQKSAIIMVALGSDYAAKIYKHLKDEEIETLTLEVATLQRLDSEKIDNVLKEFYEMCEAQRLIVEGGVDYAKDVLEKAFGISNARNVIDKVTASLGNRSFNFMKKVEPKQLFNFIQNEHPQTIALILAHATKYQASNVLGMLNKEKQVEVIERLAKMDRISPDVIKEVETALQKKLASLGANETTDIGGVKFTAELLNSVDRSAEKYIFDELNARDADLSEEIRKLMFVFEDITSLDSAAIQRLVREVDNKLLVVALKTANEEVKNAFFSNLSKRVSEQVKEDIEYARNVRARDVEAAQQQIVAKIRELEERGEIVVSHGKDDELV